MLRRGRCASNSGVCEVSADCSELIVNRRGPDSLSGVISEIDIWRVANRMLKRYGDEAAVESAIRAQELALNGDSAGAAVWLRVTCAVRQLVNVTPPGPLH